MEKLAIVGYGSMGSMLLERFFTAGVLRADEVIVTTRSETGAALASSRWPGIRTGTDNRIAAEAGTILLCVPPASARAVLLELAPLTAGRHLVSIVSSLTVGSLQSLHDGPVSRAIPSLPAILGAGVTLVCHSEDVKPVKCIEVERLFERIGPVQVLQENAFPMAANLTSCMPGFLAALLQELSKATLRSTDLLTVAQTEEMLIQTMLGTARLIVERGMEPETIVARVAPRGGVTEAGVEALRAGLPGVFDDLFARVMTRRAEMERAVLRQFTGD